MRICNDRGQAEEATLDVFHDVWRRAGAYEPSAGSVIGWLANQARSRAIDRVRFEHRKKRELPAGATAVDDRVALDHPAAGIEARQRRARVAAAVRTLAPDERAAIETAFFAELSYPETAARLDQPLGTVKTRIRAALAKLRKSLADEGEGA